MPRTARASAGGICYHVLDRGNGCGKVFHKDGDYAEFVDLLAAANERLPMRMLGYVLMPNHFQLALEPNAAGDLSRRMHWLMTSHVRRYHHHRHYIIATTIPADMFGKYASRHFQSNRTNTC
jgi:putative transposase